jgi:transposase
MHQQEANRLEAAMNQAGMRASIQSHMQWLQINIKDLERQIDDHIDKHPGLREDVELITSIPGLGNITAARVLAYLGDVRRFKNGKALAAFIGVTPRLKLSGSSVRGSQLNQPQRPRERAALPVHARYGGTQTQSLDQGVRCPLEGRRARTEGRHRRMHAQAGATDVRYLEVGHTLQSKIRRQPP